MDRPTFFFYRSTLANMAKNFGFLSVRKTGTAFSKYPAIADGKHLMVGIQADLGEYAPHHMQKKKEFQTLKKCTKLTFGPEFDVLAFEDMGPAIILFVPPHGQGLWPAVLHFVASRRNMTEAQLLRRLEIAPNY